MDAETGNTFDQDRLKLVTENFNNLQGLSTVALGIGLAVEMMVLIYWKDSHWSILGLLPMVGAFAATLTFIPRYYANRFGSVQQGSNQFDNVRVKQMVILLAAILFFWIVADVSLSLVPVVHRPDPGNFALSLVFFYAGFRIPRQRARNLVFAGIMGLAALFPLWPGLDDYQFFAWRVINAGALGIGLVIVGLWDHITLMRLLPKASEGGNE